MNDSTRDADRLLDLADSVYDDTASENELAEMDSLLIADDESRSRYLSYCWMHTAIKLELRANRAAKRLQRQIGQDIRVSRASETAELERPSALPIGVVGNTFPSTPGYFASGWPVAYLIATVIFAIGLVIGAVVHVSQPEPFAGSESTGVDNSLTVPAQAGYVGWITGMANCVWEGSGFRVRGSGDSGQDGSARHPLSAICLGDRIALKSGLLEITYNTGAKVILQGPVTYEVESVAGGFLAIGKLTAKLEKRSEARSQRSEIRGQKSEVRNQNFAVRTPTATVTDLGTEFGVEVDAQGGTTSRVYRGVVEFRVEKAQGTSQTIRLTENQSARVASGGDRVATVLREKDAPPAFVRAMPAPPQRVPIKLFNTGQGVKEGEPDPHWEIGAAGGDSGAKARTAVAVRPPLAIWMPNEPGRSQWISARSDASPLPDRAVVTFRTRFDLSQVRVNTAKLHGLFIADNHVRAIRINGQDVRVPDHSFDQFDFFHPFTIGSGFVDGVNVLEIDVENGYLAASGLGRTGDPAGGVVVFRDDFESTASASAAAYPDNSGSYNPTGPAVGRWTITKNNPNAVQVTTSRSAPDPATCDGTKCLRLRRLVQGEDLASARANFAAAAMAGDRIRLTAAVYVPAVEQDTAEIAQISVGNAVNLIANYAGHRSVVSHTNDGISHDTGVPFTAGKWQTWQIDYQVGAATCALTIDGRSAPDVPVSPVGRVEDAEFWANSIAKNPLYVDDVLIVVKGGPMGLRVELEGTAQQR